MSRQTLAKQKTTRHSSSSQRGLHRYVYAAIAVLALWFVLSAWSFAGGGYSDFLLAVVSGFILIFVAIPFVLSRVPRENGGDDNADAETEPRESFRTWASCEFDTWQYRIRARNAAVEVLLPIAAIAFGMTAFGIVLFLEVHHFI